MEDKFMTKLDILGTQKAVKEAIEKRFEIRSERRLDSKIIAFESLDDLKQKDKEREADGFPPKIKFRRILAGPGKVIVVPHIEEDQLVHGEFEHKKIIHLAQSADEHEHDLGETTGHGNGEVGDV